MTSTRQDIREIDLMAYADGLLEGDSARKAAVEAYLEENPIDAARVAAIIEDNRLIRELYAEELHRPVPQWLSRVLREPAPRRRRMPTATAASLALAVLAAGGGWFIGHSGGTAVPSELLRDIAGHHLDAQVQTAVATPSSGLLLPNLSQRVLIEVPVPDLSAHGFELTGRSVVDVGGKTMVRVVYNSSDEAINLFMRLRRNAKTTDMRDIETDDVSVHYWSEGALAYALTINAGKDRAASLAQAVRDAAQPGHFVEPPPANVAGQVEPAAGNSSQAVDGQTEPAPGLPQPRQFN
ncbi:anti-sigma factor family protein [Roseibium salinum]|uniref:Anti-sigma factor RsiW n=1 Tax=Roseibium salinum TaxID=1604349 RepID=A0ABT3R247_9HYPH|nr:hypothetical protein [Roseibium sp. DSM 29163]MCX2723274.1 hypothetical protein [Roseibium sp. DSM 29163]MDN3718813.1 hypothetical protein [Roseibium salinum]